MLPVSRTLALCLALFFTAALISLSLQRFPASESLPDFPRLKEAVQSIQTPQLHLTSGSSGSSESSKEDKSQEKRPRYAFATFISGPEKEEHAAARLADIDAHGYKQSNSTVSFVDACSGDFVDDGEDEDASLDPEGGYFLGVRTLMYTLLHQPATRSRFSEDRPQPDFIVLHTAAVPRSQLRRLQKDGATLIRVEPLGANWITEGMGAGRWGAVLDKLRLWELDGTGGTPSWDKICFIDADHLVTGPLDGVFTDPATDGASVRQWAGEGENPDNYVIEGMQDAPQLPATFMFAGKTEAGHYGHDVPPAPLAPLISTTEYDNTESQNQLDATNTYLNSGFFVLRPDKRVFDFYMWLLAQPKLFDPTFPEQNLLNRAHRRNGPMPWVALNWKFNMNWPTSRDYDAGARSFHAKYWDNDDTHDERLKKMWLNTMREMRGYYRGREEALRHMGGSKAVNNC